MSELIQLGQLQIKVTFKKIKNVHLSVHPPQGRVSISAPERMRLETVRIFAIAKLDWIQKQQKRIRAQERETPREYLEKESHYLWGERCLLKLIDHLGAPNVEHTPGKILMYLRPGADEQRKREVLDAWYRQQLKDYLPELLSYWQPKIGVEAKDVYIQRMRTRWGSCNHEAGTIRLNTELAKKPRECLEYIVVHELIHLIEPTHNQYFQAIMDHYLPQWQERRQLLNRLPLRHEEWEY